MPPRRTTKKPSPQPATAPKRMTRSRAHSQGVELPTIYHTPPDIVKRRKASKSSQEIEEVYEPVEVEIEEQDEEDREEEEEEELEEEEGEEDEAEGDVEEAVLDSSPLARKTHFSLISEFGTPDGESTPVSILEYDYHSEVADAVLVPTVSSAVAVLYPRPYLTPAKPRTDVASIQNAVALRRTSPVSAMPAEMPSSKKRRHAQSLDKSSSSSSSSEDSDSEDGHAVIVTFTPKPLTGAEFNRFKRIRQTLGNNPREQQAYEMNVQRVIERKRLEKLASSRNAERAESSEVNDQTPSLQIENSIPSVSSLRKTSSPLTTTQSAPNTPAQSRIAKILTPLAKTASNVFGLFGSRSAAPKLPSAPLATKQNLSPAIDEHGIQNEAPETSVFSSTLSNEDATPIGTTDFDADSSFGTIFTPSKRATSSLRPPTRRGNVRHNLKHRQTTNSTQNDSSRDADIAIDSLKSRKLQHDSFADSRPTNRRRNEDDDTFSPDENQSQGEKRKLGVGKTFSVPELPDSASETSSPSKSPTKLTAKPIKSPVSRLGKTFSMPDDSIVSSEDKTSYMDFDLMTLPFESKKVVDWTNEDQLDYYKMTWGIDPQTIAADIPRLLNGELSEACIRQAIGFRNLNDKAKAEAQLERIKVRKEIEEHRTQEFARVTDVAQREALEWEKHLHVVKKEALMWEKRCQAAQAKHYQLQAQVDAQQNALQLQDEVANQSPVQARDLNAPFNVFEAAHSHDAPSTPALTHAQLPKSNVTWTENKENHVTSPGPNAPPKYASGEALNSASKPALKQSTSTKAPTANTPVLSEFMTAEEAKGLSGRQLESYESQLSGINKYHPKQPSRLREVSRLSSSPAGGANGLAIPGQVLGPLSQTDGPFSPQDSLMHSMSDVAPSPFSEQSSFTGDSATEAFKAGRAAAIEAFAPISLLDYGIEPDGDPAITDLVYEVMQKHYVSPGFLAPELVIDTSIGIPTAELNDRVAQVLTAGGA